jgi:hypothetical protein
MTILKTTTCETVGQSGRMKLVPVKDNPDAAPFLYELLSQRPEDNWISHEKLPTPGEHEAFVANHPFRYWYLIEEDDSYVGAIEVTDRNELGVSILRKYQRLGLAKAALTLFMASHDPLPPIPAVRNGHWLANIAIPNMVSKFFFKKMGFFPIQETWAK